MTVQQALLWCPQSVFVEAGVAPTPVHMGTIWMKRTCIYYAVSLDVYLRLEPAWIFIYTVCVCVCVKGAGRDTTPESWAAFWIRTIIPPPRTNQQQIFITSMLWDKEQKHRCKIPPPPLNCSLSIRPSCCRVCFYLSAERGKFLCAQFKSEFKTRKVHLIYK